MDDSAEKYNKDHETLLEEARAKSLRAKDYVDALILRARRIGISLSKLSDMINQNGMKAGEEYIR